MQIFNTVGYMKSAKCFPVILTALIFFLTGCSENDLAFEEIKDGLCSQKQEQLIEKHIAGKSDKEIYLEQRQALLDKLGITEEEAKLFLG